MEAPVTSTGGPETESQKIPVQNEGDVDYSLLERLVTEGSLTARLALATRLISSDDRQMVSIGIDAIPQMLADGVMESSDPEVLDMLRNLWRGTMLSQDGDTAYEAQELYVILAPSLEEKDITTFGWLKDSVRVDWFDG